MKPSTSCPLIALFMAALFASSFAKEKIIADTVIGEETPYLVVTPQRPIAGKDSVMIQIIFGTASNSCEAPTYSNLSFTINESPLAVYPPLFTVEVQFSMHPVPLDRICTDVYNPVDYGPRFMLGKLRAGSYQVVYGGPMVTSEPVNYGGFSVYESANPPPYTIKGTVFDDPSPMKRASMPVARATVYLYSRAIPVLATDASSDRVVAPVILRDSAITDEGGNYALSAVPSGSYTLTCRHPDYRIVSLSAVIRMDTVINFILIPADARATVTGVVTHARPMDSHPLPLAGCTVVVEKSPLIYAASEAAVPILPISYRAVTDAGGRYTVDNIPVGANGEIWNVHAFFSTYSGTKRVALYNMRTDTADFFFTAPYENSASVNVDGVVFTTAAEKFIYQEKEPVRIRYSITNTTTNTKTFGPFSQGCEYDLIVTGMPDLELYRASSQPICIDLLSEITVNPGETVIHDFPGWYMTNIKQLDPTTTIIAPRSVTLKMSARLQGSKYDNTLVGVPVTIELEPPVGVAGTVPAKHPAGVSFNAQKQLLTLNLDKSQSVSIAVYSLDGAVMPAHSMKKNLPSGLHTLSLQNVGRSRGCYIVGVKGESFAKRFSAVNISR